MEVMWDSFVFLYFKIRCGDDRYGPISLYLTPNFFKIPFGTDNA